MPKAIIESDVEENVLSILQSHGYEIIGADKEEYLPGGSSALRDDYKDVVLVERLREALNKINPSILDEAREQAVKQVLRSESQKLIANNETFHKMLVDGIDIPFQTAEGERYNKVWLYDFNKPENNAFLAVNQFTVIENNVFHGFDYEKFFHLKPSERISFIPDAMEHILKEKDKRERFEREVMALLKAFSLAVPHDRAMKIKEEVGLSQAIKSAITKTTETGKENQEEKFDIALKQILSKAVISDRVIDIFEAAGIQKPELSILSEGFLAEVREMPQKNLAFEALKKLLNDEIRILSRRNIVQGKSFMDMLDKTIKKYTNRSVEAAQVIEELLELARKVREEKNGGKQQNMTEDEIAFYDALGTNDSAVKVLGDETLRKIALELTQMIRNSVTIDWTQRESVQAEIRLKVKKILRKYGYPPDRETRATETVLKQAGIIARDWAK